MYCMIHLLRIKKLNISSKVYNYGTQNMIIGELNSNDLKLPQLEKKIKNPSTPLNTDKHD